MPVVPRNPAETQYGYHAAILTAGGDHVLTFTNVGLRFTTSTQTGRAARDFNAHPVLDVTGVTVDFSKVVESTLPLVLLALTNNPTFTGTFRHARAGTQYAGTFVMTRAQWEMGEGAQSESATAELQGDIMSSVPGITADPGRRTTANLTKFAKDIAVVSFDTNDFALLVTECSVEVAITTQTGRASRDTLAYPVPTERAITMSASKVVQAGATVGGHTLPFMEMHRARAAVGVSITPFSGFTPFTGTFVVTNSGLDISENGAQMENITLECQGTITQA